MTATVLSQAEREVGVHDDYLPQQLHETYYNVPLKRPSITKPRIEELTAILNRASSFDVQSKMLWNQRTAVHLKIDRSRIGNAPPQVMVGGKVMKLGEALNNVTVSAVLKGGDGFKIDSVTEGPVRLSSEKPTVWTWYVKPADRGDHSLTLAVQAIPSSQGGAPQSILEKEVKVSAELDWQDVFLFYLKKANEYEGVGWAGIIGAIFVAASSRVRHLFRMMLPPQLQSPQPQHPTPTERQPTTERADANRERAISGP